MDLEPDGSDDAIKRNHVRSSLTAAFESVSVWLLPAPTERTSDLRKVHASEREDTGFERCCCLSEIPS